MNRIMVFGKSGQVASELLRRVPDDITLLPVSRAEADLIDPETCSKLIFESDIDAVINAAAYTAVDRAEEEEAIATQVNGKTPGAIAQAAAEKKIPFLHISTDYVFSGKGASPFFPTSTTEPINAYGRSKLLGEKLIQSANGSHAILRTSWIFSKIGSNFFKSMVNIGQKNSNISVVSDQIGGPTPASAIADAILSMSVDLINDKNKSGVYHLSGYQYCSWSQFAREIFDIAGIDCIVEDISSSDWPTAAKRPLNSRLDCSSLERTFNIKRPSWRDSLRSMIDDLGI